MINKETRIGGVIPGTVTEATPAVFLETERERLLKKLENMPLKS